MTWWRSFIKSFLSASFSISPPSGNAGSVLSRAGRGGRGGRLLLVCHDGGLVSHTVSALLSLAGSSPLLLTGGYQAYRQFVQTLLARQDSQEADWVSRLRYIVITGPEDGGREDVIGQLDGQGAQILNLEQLAKETTSTTTTTTTQSKFESRVCFALRWRLQADKELKWQLYN